MTRSSEFCYLAETKDGKFVQAMLPTLPGLPMIFTDDPEQSLRLTFDGFHALRKQCNFLKGARKVLAS